MYIVDLTTALTVLHITQFTGGVTEESILGGLTSVTTWTSAGGLLTLAAEAASEVATKARSSSKDDKISSPGAAVK